ncbi:MAG: type II toxin-antitoxin system VapB family antitoxin [Dermatophilaceae bacterium]
MGMNIKNERVHALAREAARVTGKSQTSAIEEALEQFLRAHGADPEASRRAHRLDLARSIVAAYSAEPARPDRETRRAEDLYDGATGLPR